MARSADSQTRSRPRASLQAIRTSRSQRNPGLGWQEEEVTLGCMEQPIAGSSLLRLPEDALFRVQLHLPALDVAFFRAASSTCAALVRRSYASRLAKEGLPRHLTLRELHRRQKALFHEDFRRGWSSGAWQAGPHQDDEAYVVRDVVSVEGGNSAGRLTVGSRVRVVTNGDEPPNPRQQRLVNYKGELLETSVDINGMEGFLVRLNESEEGDEGGFWDVCVCHDATWGGGSRPPPPKS